MCVRNTKSKEFEVDLTTQNHKEGSKGHTNKIVLGLLSLKTGRKHYRPSGESLTRKKRGTCLVSPFEVHFGQKSNAVKAALTVVQVHWKPQEEKICLNTKLQ